MSRNKYSSFRKAERVWKTLFKANVTVLLLVLMKNVNISRLNRIGRQLQPVELAAGELAVNWQTTSAWSLSFLSKTNLTWKQSSCEQLHKWTAQSALKITSIISTESTWCWVMLGNHGPREFELHPRDNHGKVKSPFASLGTTKLKRQAGFTNKDGFLAL